MKYDFHRDLANGKKYEQKYTQLLLDRGVSPDWLHLPQGHHPAYDIKLSIPGCKPIKYEVKRDYHFARTNNILIELWSNVEAKGPGWWIHTKADVLIVFYSDTEYYEIKMDELAWWASNCFKDMREHTITQPGGYHTSFYLLDANTTMTQDVFLNGKFERLTKSIQLQRKTI